MKRFLGVFLGVCLVFGGVALADQFAQGLDLMVTGGLALDGGDMIFCGYRGVVSDAERMEALMAHMTAEEPLGAAPEGVSTVVVCVSQEDSRALWSFAVAGDAGRLMSVVPLAEVDQGGVLLAVRPYSVTRLPEATFIMLDGDGNEVPLPDGWAVPADVDGPYPLDQGFFAQLWPTPEAQVLSDGEVAVMARYGADGSLLWQAEVPGLEDFRMHDIAEADGGYLIVGMEVRGDFEEITPVVAMLDEGGGLRWRQEVDAGEQGILYHIVPLKEGGAMVAGITGRGETELFLAAVDAEGELLWTRAYGDEMGPQFPYGMLPAGDESVVLTGQYYSDGSDNMLLSWVDAKGEVLRSEGYGLAWTTGSWPMLLQGPGMTMVTAGNVMGAQETVFIRRMQTRMD